MVKGYKECLSIGPDYIRSNSYNNHQMLAGSYMESVPVAHDLGLSWSSEKLIIYNFVNEYFFIELILFSKVLARTLTTCVNRYGLNVMERLMLQKEEWQSKSHVWQMKLCKWKQWNHYSAQKQMCVLRFSQKYSIL